jgi:hypothetical protein
VLIPEGGMGWLWLGVSPWAQFPLGGRELLPEGGFSSVVGTLAVRVICRPDLPVLRLASWGFLGRPPGSGCCSLVVTRCRLLPEPSWAPSPVASALRRSVRLSREVTGSTPVDKLQLQSPGLGQVQG